MSFDTTAIWGLIPSEKSAAPRLPLVSFGDVEAQMNTEELRWPEIGCSLTIAHDITKAKGE
jgi:hypothetical protein